MEGVEIIRVIANSIIWETHGIWSVQAVTALSAFTGVVIALVVMRFSGLWKAASVEGNRKLKIVASFTALLPLLGAIIGYAVSRSAVTTVAVGEEHTYEASVSDCVSLNDFYSKYEVIEHNGSTYVIKERVIYEVPKIESTN